MKKYFTPCLTLLLLIMICMMAACQTGIDTATETVTDDPTQTATDPSMESDATADAASDIETTPDTDTDTATHTTQADTDTNTEPDTETATAPATEPETAGTEPIFSAEGGLYDSALTLTISLPDGLPEGAVIRYTKSGATPGRNSTLYTEPLEILTEKSDTLTLRAACFDPSGNRLGAVVTQTYLRVEQPEGMWVVMISVAEKDLNAMTASPNEKIEKPAHVELVTPEGERVISQDAGLRLFGGSSRTLAQKSFKLIARKDGYFGETAAYTGKGSFAYPLFSDRIVRSGKKEGQVLGKYDSFILRNGGNDSLLSTAADPTDPTLLRDGLANNFASKWAPAVDTSLSQFAVVYINGAYYGILDMRENLNEDYVKRVYGVDDDDVVVVKSELDTSRHCDLHANGASCRFCDVWFYYETDEDAISQAAMKEWIGLCKQAINGLSLSSTEQQALYAQLSEKIDMESFLQYMALNLYLCNTDWPYNNVKLWKYTGEPVEGIAITDGKWRFMTRDMDMCFARYSSPEILPDLDSRAERDTFWRTLGNYISGYSDYYQNSGTDRLYPDSLYIEGLFAFCLQNSAFRSDFWDYAESLASTEATDELLALYNEGYTLLNSAIKAHISRWQDHVQMSARDWKRAAGRIKSFINDRPEQFLAHLKRLWMVL